jgi:hypothetical protein
MRHFHLYNEPTLIPLIYHYSGLFPIERQGPQYLLPVFDNMLSRYIRIYDGLYDLFEAQALPPEQFTKTLDALYASPRAKKLDCLSLNVYDPCADQEGRVHDGRRSVSHVHPCDEGRQHRSPGLYG